MCGIFCVFSETSNLNVTEKFSKIFQEFSLNISRRGPNHSKIEICHNEDTIFLFASSVLWLQGNKLTKQPIIENDHILLYNGDIFNDENENQRNAYGDTKLFLDYFKSDQSLCSLFNTNGPFSFICLDKTKSILHIGRDKYGRRSLLLGKSNEGEIIVTSVAKRTSSYKFIELPSLGILSFNFKTQIVTLKPWYRENVNSCSKIREIEIFLGKNLNVEEPISDSLFIKDFIEPTEIELTIYRSLDSSIRGTDILSYAFSCNKFADDVQELKRRLENSIKRRITGQPDFCQNCIKKQQPCDHAVVGVLFSGGVDCAVIALLAHKFVPINKPIDLLNVAFSKYDFNTPDRITGLQTLRELEKLCPERTWKFVEINVKDEELDKEREKRIADLIYPLNTILDDSLGCALWFASRGQSEDYTSPSRILLVGTGADELFGGYSRHRAAFRNESWIGLHKVLKEDWENLPYRNLGRDDRVVSDNGRQLRTPYLDEDVVQFVQSLNCWEKTFPSKDDTGPKFLLRGLAFHLHLKNAAVLKKRALQFGSRIANSKENARNVSPRL
ncbi:asparagine synthetase domain-containing protein CG17486 [Coccinella septempunctata]|uniref:asparagine synthetase domain-containing protein CG17486 n=1 Tax=Coccinella septempunctata TaxID=41139 RepID=UPI001D0750AE|nr:asparagine synthetase domain-containing protein CG17486 [Coccinella septempunctata]